MTDVGSVSDEANDNMSPEAASKTEALAVAVAEQFGWYVFPVRVSTDRKTGKKIKRPSVRAWNTPGVGCWNTEAEIREAFRREPGSRVGIACGPSGVLVVDQDRPVEDPSPDWADALDVSKTVVLKSQSWTEATPWRRHFVFSVNNGRDLSGEVATGDVLGYRSGGLPIGDLKGVGGFVVLGTGRVEGSGSSLGPVPPVLDEWAIRSTTSGGSWAVSVGSLSGGGEVDEGVLEELLGQTEAFEALVGSDYGDRYLKVREVVFGRLEDQYARWGSRDHAIYRTMCSEVVTCLAGGYPLRTLLDWCCDWLASHPLDSNGVEDPMTEEDARAKMRRALAWVTDEEVAEVRDSRMFGLDDAYVEELFDWESIVGSGGSLDALNDEDDLKPSTGAGEALRGALGGMDVPDWSSGARDVVDDDEPIVPPPAPAPAAPLPPIIEPTTSVPVPVADEAPAVDPMDLHRRMDEMVSAATSKIEEAPTATPAPPAPPAPSAPSAPSAPVEEVTPVAPASVPDATAGPEVVPSPAPAEPEKPEVVAPPVPAEIVEEITPEMRRLIERKMLDLKATSIAKDLLIDEKAQAEWAVIEDQIDHRMGDVMLLDDPPVADWTISNLLLAGQTMLVSASPKAGKTRLALNLLRTFVDGDAFLGALAAPRGALPGNTAYLQADMGLGQFMGWVGEQGIAHPEKIWPLDLQGRTAGFDVRSPSVRAKWAEFFKRQGCVGGALIVDVLQSVVAGLGLSESNEDLGKILEGLLALKVEVGFEHLIVIHHHGHGAERARGGSVLLGKFDVVADLVLPGRGLDDSTGTGTGGSGDGGTSALSGAARYFKAYGRDVDLQESKLVFDPATGRMTISMGASRTAARVKAKTSKMTEAMITVLAAAGETPSPGDGGYGGLSIREVRAEVPGSNENKERVLKDLEADGLVERLVEEVEGRRGGPKVIYRLTEAGRDVVSGADLLMDNPDLFTMPDAPEL